MLNRIRPSKVPAAVRIGLQANSGRDPRKVHRPAGRCSLRLRRSNLSAPGQAEEGTREDPFRIQDKLPRSAAGSCAQQGLLEH